MGLKNEEIFKGQWVIDSETGIQYLVDISTGKILLRTDSDGTILYDGAKQ